MASKFAEIYVLLGLKKEGFDKGVKETDRSLSGMASSFKTSAIAVAATGAAIAIAGKQIYELGKRGAIVTQTADSFDYLTKKLGLAPDILEQLRKASRGTIDDMTLMSSTATLLAGTSDELGKALGQATPQLLEIAKAANKLNPSLGTTSHMYESIALGIKRASPMILDNLGLTIKIGQANEEFAKQLGKSVDQLTAEEKQMALLNATLKAGNQLIEQVGGNVDAATDSYAQMETAVTNLKDEFAALAAEGLAPTMTLLADVTSQARENTSTWGMVNDALREGTITQQEYTSWLKDYLFHGATQSELLATIESRTGLVSGAVIELTGHERAYTEQLIELTGHERAYIGVTDESTAALGENAAAVDSVKSATDLLNVSLKTYSDRLLFNLASQNMDAEAALNLAEQLGLVDQRTIAAYKSVDFLTQKYDTNKDGVISNTEATDGYIAAITNLKGSLDSSSGAMTITSGAASRLGEQLRNATRDANATAAALRRASGNYSATFTLTTIIKKYGLDVPEDPLGGEGGGGGGGGGGYIPPDNRNLPRQHGGPVHTGQSYLVGESGTELFVPNQSGRVVANGEFVMQGMSKGIGKESKQSNKQAKSAANDLVGSFEKELGISSPSRVFYDIGRDMMDGLSSGIRDGMPHVQRSLDDGMRNASGILQERTRDMDSIWNAHLNDINMRTQDAGRSMGSTWSSTMDDLKAKTNMGAMDLGAIWTAHLQNLDGQTQTAGNDINMNWNGAMADLRDNTHRAGNDINNGWSGAMNRFAHDTHSAMNTATGAVQRATQRMRSDARSAADAIRAYYAGIQNSPNMRLPNPYPSAPDPYTKINPDTGLPYGRPGYDYPVDNPDPYGKPMTGQHGLSFDVPSGYPNDSYFAPMRLTSGEHVEVTPVNQSRRGKRGSTNVLNIYTNAPVESDVSDLLLLRAWASG